MDIGSSQEHCKISTRARNYGEMNREAAVSLHSEQFRAMPTWSRAGVIVPRVKRLHLILRNSVRGSITVSRGYEKYAGKVRTSYTLSPMTLTRKSIYQETQDAVQHHENHKHGVVKRISQNHARPLMNQIVGMFRSSPSTSHL